MRSNIYIIIKINMKLIFIDCNEMNGKRKLKTHKSHKQIHKDVFYRGEGINCHRGGMMRS